MSFFCLFLEMLRMQYMDEMDMTMMATVCGWSSQGVAEVVQEVEWAVVPPEADMALLLDAQRTGS